MSNRRFVSSAALAVVVAASLAACSAAPDTAPSATSAELPAAPVDGVPTFDAAEDWYGMNSPVLIWTAEEREAYLDSIAEDVAAASEEQGLTGDESPIALAAALEDVLPRPARELLLLDSLEITSEDPSYLTGLESIVLDYAWETCLDLQGGASYADVVGSTATGADVLAVPVTDVGTATAAGIALAPVVCPAFADDAN
jgi:hypothetical protein